MASVPEYFSNFASTANANSENDQVIITKTYGENRKNFETPS